MDPNSTNISEVAKQPVSHSKPCKTKGGKGVQISYVNTREGHQQQMIVAPPANEVDILLKPKPVGLGPKQQLDYDRCYQAVMDRLPRVETNWHDPDVMKDGKSYYDENGKVTILVGVYQDPAYEIGLRAVDDAHRHAIKTQGAAWFGSDSAAGKFYDKYKSVVMLSGTDDTPDEMKKLCMRMKIKPGPNTKTDTQIIIMDQETGEMRYGTAKEVTLNSRIIPVVKNGGIYYRGKDEAGGMLFCTAMIVFPHSNCTGVDVLTNCFGIDLSGIIPGAAVPRPGNYDDNTVHDTEPDTNTVISGPTWGVRGGDAGGPADPSLFP